MRSGFWTEARIVMLATDRLSAARARFHAILLPAGLFGGLTVFFVGLIYAFIGLAAAITGVAWAIGGIPKNPGSVAGFGMLFMPFVLYVAAMLVALPAGITAAGLFMLFGSIAARCSAPRPVFIAVGTLSAYLAEKIVFDLWWKWHPSLAAVQLATALGFFASVLVMYLPAFRAFTGPWERLRPTLEEDR